MPQFAQHLINKSVYSFLQFILTISIVFPVNEFKVNCVSLLPCFVLYYYVFYIVYTADTRTEEPVFIRALRLRFH